MIPIQYVWRNLKRRKLRTAMTVGGVALVIAIYTVMNAIATTMVSGFRMTGEADEVAVMQAGALTVDFSNVPRSSLNFVRTLDGVAVAAGAPLVSPEIRLGCVLDGEEEVNVDVRGIRAAHAGVYGQVRLAEGEWPSPGFRATLGRKLAERLGAGLGTRLRFEGAEWEVVGLLSSGGRVYDQEIWVDLDDLAAAAKRDAFSSYTLRVAGEEAADGLIEAVNANRRFPLRAMAARAFYAQAGGMSSAMAGAGSFLALITAVGAVFGGMNTMYAAVAGRRREIGVLRALGFRRRSVLFAILLESLLLCGLGGLAGVVLGLALARVPFELPYLASSAVAVGGEHVAKSLALALAIGILGGVLPALRGARERIVDALAA